MRIARRVLGGLLILIGAAWFLQGINVLPGSLMTGQTRWAVYGGIAVASGVGLFGRRSAGQGNETAVRQNKQERLDRRLVPLQTSLRGIIEKHFNGLSVWSMNPV